MLKINKLVKEKDASDACVFLGIPTALKTIEIIEAAEVEQNMHDTLECLKSITVGAILNFQRRSTAIDTWILITVSWKRLM